jgi:DNA-binding CsgD family transcriptional regulator
MDSTKIVDVETPDKRYKLVSSEYGFSVREADILLLMSQGLTVDEIADSLFISKK